MPEVMAVAVPIQLHDRHAWQPICTYNEFAKRPVIIGSPFVFSLLASPGNQWGSWQGNCLPRGLPLLGVGRKKNLSQNPRRIFQSEDLQFQNRKAAVIR